MDKIQVGKDVWIKPNAGRVTPALGAEYWIVTPDGRVANTSWQPSLSDYALLACGNFFLTKEEAEAAIIKPVDPTPITYKQWVEAGRPPVYCITTGAKVLLLAYMAPGALSFDLCKIWFTHEAAEAWLTRWHAENGSAE